MTTTHADEAGVRESPEEGGGSSLGAGLDLGEGGALQGEGGLQGKAMVSNRSNTEKNVYILDCSTCK